MSWQPILEGGLKDRAQESVEAILQAIGTSEGDAAEAASLAGGTAGVAILHAYLAETGRGQEHTAIAAGCLERATAAAAEHGASASLYSGLAGVGWALAHVQSRLPGLDRQEELAEIDRVLLEHLEQSPWPDTYDLIGGLVGFGVYALERAAEKGVRTHLPERPEGCFAQMSPDPFSILERVIEQLADTAERRPEGITWVSCQEWLPPELHDRYPRRYHNLGLAHGVPGVVAFLGLACAAGAAVAKARPMLDGAVRWLLAQQTPSGFPSGIALDQAAKPARLAWCYGDPGVAAALLGAARCVQEPAWEREALAIACRAARRPAEQSGVVDAGLCHGAAGLGHLFNRMFQATGEARLAEASRFWFERTLQMQRPGRGIGGYEAGDLGEDGEWCWVAKAGLLTGAAGIALALAGATSTVEPAWDRMLLVAVPPMAGAGARADGEGL